MFLDLTHSHAHVPFGKTSSSTPSPKPLPPSPRWTSERLKDLVLDCGADDVGVVSIARAELDPQRQEMQLALPGVKVVVAFVKRMSRGNVQSVLRSVANTEFHASIDDVNHVAQRAVRRLEEAGVRAANPAAAFPMEMDRFPEKSWVVSHKPIAVAAGLGQMGIHRNIIHPVFGNFILLGTLLVDVVLDDGDEQMPIDYNPCLSCKLCVAACPVGAIAPDGSFDFSACYTHNYREFMSGFSDFVEDVVAADDRADFRRRRPLSESVSMWQSLAYGPNYKAAYCMAVCPAGEEVIAPFLDDKPAYLDAVVRPLQAKEETLYVLKGSNAEAHAEKRFPHKKRKRVRNGLYATTVQGFLRAAHLAFRPSRAAGLQFTTHFTFTGDIGEVQATFVIDDGTLRVEQGHIGEAELRIVVDGDTWLRIARGDERPLWPLLTRRLRVKGLKWMPKFGACFG